MRDDRQPDSRRGLGRETRLLLVTITISVVVLLLLSRLRFQATPLISEAGPVPLDRLASRATYNDLAAVVAVVERRIAGSLVVLRVAPRDETGSQSLADVLRSAPAETVRHVPALRVSRTTAIAAIDPDGRLVGVAGAAEGAAEIVARDPMRRLMLVTVPEAASDAPRQVTLSDLQTPAYVVVAEGTRAGVAFRPVFVGSGDRFNDPRWERPLLAVSSVALTAPGALVFSLDGQFLGCALVEDGTLAIAGARELIATAERLASGGGPHGAEPGISVQPLTPSLAAALGARQGVVVASVAADGAAAGLLEPADVISGVDDEPVETVRDFFLRLARRPAGAEVALSVSRAGQPPHQVTLTLRDRRPAAAATTPIELQHRPGAGSLVTALAPESPLASAGLRVGDLVVRAGSQEAPSPAQLSAALGEIQSGAYLVAVVERHNRPQILALPAPPAR